MTSPDETARETQAVLWHCRTYVLAVIRDRRNEGNTPTADAFLVRLDALLARIARESA